MAAAKTHIGCTLELGGKSPHIVFDDADLDLAIPIIATTMVQSAGQTCSAGSRVLVARRAYDKFVEALADAFSRLTAGTPEMDRDLGPVINATQKRRIEGFFERAHSDAIPIIAEAKIADGVPHGGFFVGPRVYGPSRNPTHSPAKRCSDRYWRSCPSTTRAMLSASLTTPIMGLWPPYGRGTAIGPCGSRAA
jgi:acyl-CoA reductase-like NAD-dependent aldehyde dehydrogenase